ncbi:MAG: von Willebrand factor type A domain-containing protein [Clostridium sp.]|nr:von Willebrand factor type A domain-containing protein [Bacteroides sp.]MCM1199303.1 von Willebrand factor type A domain-containing protein [Clostridium sp.]
MFHLSRTLIPLALFCACFSSCDKAGIYFYDGEYGGPPSYIQNQGNGFGGTYNDFTDNPFISTSENSISTFSVDADGASYANMRKFITVGNRLPYKSAVRIEEFLNYFTFDYEEPSGEDNVAINCEVSDCPWASGHKLIRLGIKGKSIPDDQVPPANYVFLIDVSGSMNSIDKIGLLKKGLMALADNLRPDDRVSIITYSGQVTKLLESTLASDSDTIKKAIGMLVASGSTAGGEAMKMAYEEAIANYIEGGNNRIIMGTDGDFNVGVTSTIDLVEMVESYAEKNIYLTICGFGSDNLNDAMMERVSNSGNGTYEYIDSEDELTKVFVNERQKFYSVANDAKIQVRFNTETVASYRLIGYENRVLTDDDFVNDRKDAGEIGAGQTITALYEIIPAEGYGNGKTSCGTFDFRYKKALDSGSIPLSIEIEDKGTGMSEEMSFAAGTAAFGMILRESPHKGSSTFSMAEELVQGGLSFDPYGYRRQFLEIIGKAEKL